MKFNIAKGVKRKILKNKYIHPVSFCEKGWFCDGVKRLCKRLKYGCFA